MLNSRNVLISVICLKVLLGLIDLFKFILDSLMLLCICQS